MRTILIVASLFVLAASVGAGELPWPTAGWAQSTPEAQGMDGSVLAKFDAELARGEQGYVDGMLVIRNGRVIYEKSYRHDYRGLFATVPDRKPGIYNYYDPDWHPYYKGSDLHTLQSGPLGVQRFYWKRTPTGHPDTEGGLYLAPRDLAKLGYLFEHDGVWNGKRILRAGWAAESTAAHVPVAKDGPPVYGYQWWTLPAPGRPAHFAARGYGGQYLLVVPSLDLIAVFTGWNIYDKPELKPDLALQRVLEA